MPVQAYATSGPKEALAPFSISRRELRPSDVLIEIHFCGICHSDVHQARDEWGGSRFPMVPGHEIAGVVARVGSKVTRFKTGDRVGVGCFVDSCRECSACLEGLEQYCERGMTGTYNDTERDGRTPTFGGYSTQIVVDENYVLRIPDSLPLDRAAPLLCAGITTYSPLRHWNVGPGKKVAVVGLGGLGHMAVKLAHSMGAEVSVISHSNRKKADSERLGAHRFYASSETDLNTLATSFDLILNTVSAELDWNQYLQMLRRDGALVVVGIPPKAVPVQAFNLVFNRRSLAGSLIGGIRETQEMLDFCGQDGVASDVEVIPIQKVNEAYERMLKGDVRYRFVIDLNSLRTNPVS